VLPHCDGSPDARCWWRSCADVMMVVDGLVGQGHHSPSSGALLQAPRLMESVAAAHGAPAAAGGQAFFLASWLLHAPRRRAVPWTARVSRDQVGGPVSDVAGLPPWRCSPVNRCRPVRRCQSALHVCRCRPGDFEHPEARSARWDRDRCVEKTRTEDWTSQREFKLAVAKARQPCSTGREGDAKHSLPPPRTDHRPARPIATAATVAPSAR